MAHQFVRRLIATAAVLIGVLGWTQHASAATAYGLTTTNTIIIFDTATPGTIVRTLPINFFSGVPPETILAISTPRNNQVVALASHHLYSIDLVNGYADLLKTFSTPFNGTAFGVDENPIDHSVRIVSDTGQNLRYSGGKGGSLTTDPNLSPPGSVVACAYTNAFFGIFATTTTLYGIDSASDTLVRQGSIDGTPISPNSGAITAIGPLGVDTTASAGLAIGFNNQAFGSLTVGGVSGLYTIDLSTGAASLVGNFSGGLTIRSLAVSSPVAVTLYGLADGNNLITFNSTTPGTIRSTVPITGLQPGETIVGIDEQPQTAQLYGVGSSSRLYSIDATTGAATPVGPVPFSPALNGSAYGVTFDRPGLASSSFRVEAVADSGQDLTLDSRSGIASANPPLPPGSHVVAATTVVLNFGEASNGQPYGIDSASDQLVVLPGANPVGSLGVDTTDVAAMTTFAVFDEGRRTFNAPAWAALQVGGLSRLYMIDLATGAATLIGTIGTGAPVHGLTIAQPGQAQLTALAYVVRESSGTLTVPLIRTGSTVGRLQAGCQTFTIAAGATPGVDFTPIEQTVVFEDGVSTATCSIPILDDALAEPVEQFVIAVGPMQAVVSILDDDGPNPLPSIAITSPTSSPTLTAHSSFITLAGTASAGVVSVKWSTAGPYGVFASGTAVGTTNWTAANIPLHAGLNGLTVQATDASGATNIAVLTVTVRDLQYALAEGATGGFFDTDILLANPFFDVPIYVSWLKEDGTTVTQVMTLPGSSRTTIPVASIPGLEGTSMSTFVTSPTGQPIAVERTMRWDRTGYGAHGEKASDGTALTWYFAEGSQGYFNTFLMLANPGPTSNQATVEFLFEDGGSITKTYALKPTSRFTLFAGDVPELINRSFGMTVTFAQPGMAERAMYFGTPLFNGGHDSAGTTDLSTTWYLAEGATGSFFTTFLELANPGTTAGDVTVTYLPASGTPVTKTYTLAAKQRRSFNIAFENPSLVSAAVGAQITSTVPIVVERSQYWPYSPDQWYESHNSGGVTAPGKTWALAEGRVGGPNAYQTYILLANYDTQPADVTIDFLREPGKSPQTVTKTFHVNATSRFNVAIPGSDVPELADETFGAYITASAPIVVERSMYSDANGQVWAAGTNATATRMP